MSETPILEREIPVLTLRCDLGIVRTQFSPWSNSKSDSGLWSEQFRSLFPRLSVLSTYSSGVCGGWDVIPLFTTHWRPVLRTLGANSSARRVSVVILVVPEWQGRIELAQALEWFQGIWVVRTDAIRWIGTAEGRTACWVVYPLHLEIS